ncbi:MAG: hypothetical protein AAFZ67_08520 [Planctomycetota bacterium]
MRLEPRELPRWLARHAIPIETGIAAGRVQYRSLEKMSGLADPMGVSGRGRLGDLNVLQTAIADRPTFRRREIAPTRRVLALIDLRAGDDRVATARLLAAAKLACGIVLAMPETTLTMTTVGTMQPAPPETFFSLEDYRSLHATLDTYGSLAPNARAHAGNVKRALGADPDAHALIVTHFWHDRLGYDFVGTLGTTMFLVQPKSYGFIGGIGAAGGAQGFYAGADREDVIDEMYSVLRDHLRARRVRSTLVPARPEIVTAMEQALGTFR